MATSIRRVRSDIVNLYIKPSPASLKVGGYADNDVTYSVLDGGVADVA